MLSTVCSLCVSLLSFTDVLTNYFFFFFSRSFMFFSSEQKDFYYFFVHVKKVFVFRSVIGACLRESCNGKFKTSF